MRGGREGADSIHFGKRIVTPPNFILEQLTESHSNSVTCNFFKKQLIRLKCPNLLNVLLPFKKDLGQFLLDD